MQREKKGLVRKYISDELREELYCWKNERNTYIHDLMKQSLHTEDLQGFAEKGQVTIKTLGTKVSLYNRYLGRHPEKL